MTSSDDDLLEADLDAYLDDTFDVPAGEQLDEELPPIVNADQADLLLRRRNGVVAEISRIEGIAERRVSALSAWVHDRTWGARRRLAHLDAALEAWTRAALADSKRAKTQNLPHGSVSLRGHRDVVRVLDVELFAKWCDTNEHATFVKSETVHKPQLDEIAKLTAKGEQLEDVDIDGIVWQRWQTIDPQSGEIIPDVEYRKQRLDTFSVKP